MNEHAIKVTGVDHVSAVIGGFHLSAVASKTRKTITFHWADIGKCLWTMKVNN